MVRLVITSHAPDGPRYPWADLLQTVNRRIHQQQAQVEAHPPPEWFGVTGASEAELAQYEERLGMRLPPSYREFLQVSNGWDEEGWSFLHLFSLAEVRWTRDVDPDLAETWGDPLGDTLYISEYFDGQVCLLNPHVVQPDGEWQALDFATWHPGVIEYRSFWDLMTDMYADFEPEEPASTVPGSG